MNYPCCIYFLYLLWGLPPLYRCLVHSISFYFEKCFLLSQWTFWIVLLLFFFFNTTAVSHWGRINWKRRNTFTITHSMTILPEVHWHYSSGVPPTCSIPIPLELRVQVLCFPPPGLESNYRLPESLHKFSLLTLQQHINSS